MANLQGLVRALRWTRTTIAALAVASLAITPLALGTVSTAAQAADDEGTVAGFVTGPEGGVLGNVVVTAYEASDGGSWEPRSSTTTDAGGSFALQLPESTYRIGFAPSSSRHLPEFYENAATVEAATDVPVRAGTMVAGIAGVLELPQLPDPGEFRNLVRPVLSGTPVVGQVLKISAGTWSEELDHVTYDWYDNDEQIGSAMDRTTLKLTRAQLGKRIYVFVHVSNAAGDTKLIQSNSVGPVRLHPCAAAAQALVKATKATASRKAALAKAQSRVRQAQQSVRKLQSGPRAKLAHARKQLKVLKARAAKAKKAHTRAVKAQRSAAKAKANACK